jgi:transketolase
MKYEDALLDLAQRDDRIVVMTAENRAAIRNLPPKLGDRFIDVGIAEQTMLAAAAGLALRGRRPIVHALAAFLTMRAYEFIRTDVGIANLPVVLVGGVPGVLSEANGPTHQAIEDVALMRGIPGMRVFTPSSRAELLDGLPEIVADDAPWYVRFVDDEPDLVRATSQPFGRASVTGEGRDVAILTYGFMRREAEAARRALGRDGVDASVVSFPTLSPFDVETVLAAAERSRLLVTAEDHFVAGGLFSIVSEALVRRRRSKPLPPVLPIGFDATWFRPALLADVLAVEGLRGVDLAARIQKELRS